MSREEMREHCEVRIQKLRQVIALVDRVPNLMELLAERSKGKVFHGDLTRESGVDKLLENLQKLSI